MKIKIIIFFQVLFLIFSSFIFGDYTSSLFESNYEGNDNNVLALSKDIKITETDLYLYLLLTQNAPANLYEKYLISIKNQGTYSTIFLIN
jgi:hypothetical protein